MTGSIIGGRNRSLTLVIGGARSGKSAFAQKLCNASGGPVLCIATATASDAEMTARIARHRQDRPAGWETREVPMDLAHALATLPGDRMVLVDCATLWLSNQMLAGREAEAEGFALLAALTACAAPVVIVSNEVGCGIVPETPLGRGFRDAQGRLNQRLAAAADTVVTVIAGLPLALKGALPPG
jgi:adenosylcobinamide kinase / adenosylcobinamide-phosphate guanylyltransferase